MGKRLAIKGHPTRGNEVIELLEMMGGKNKDNADGCSFLYYTLCTPKINNPNNDKVICGFTNLKMQNDHFAIFTLEKFLEKYPYKVGDKAVYEDDNDIIVITEIKWDNTVGDIFYNVKRIDEDDCFLCPPELLKPYKETNMNENKFSTANELPTFKINDEIEYKIPDGYEITEVSKDWVSIKPIKPKYPKTYKECCERVNACPIVGISYDSDEDMLYNDEVDLTLLTLRKLLICYKAYCKITGEEMGLGKSWEPDWSTSEPKYVLACTYNGIEKQWETTYCKTFAFPTEEIRDEFYENFKDLIELCKKLL